jgi:sugar/nucleoside kinase (ribokinase family)
VIVVQGTVCLDIICNVPFLPPPGGYVEISDITPLLGGEAANTAAWLKKWGVNVTLLANPIAHDGDAAFIRSQIVDLIGESAMFAPAVGDVETPKCFIYVTPDGQRTMYGLNFDQEFDLGAPAHFMGFDGWVSVDSNFAQFGRSFAREAGKAGAKTYLMDFYRDSDEPLCAAAGVWQSSTDWVGVIGDASANLAWCHDAQIRWAKPLVILTDGKHGTYYCEPHGEPQHVPAIEEVLVVDSTGAGDAFRAGMLYGLDHGWQTIETIRFASAAGEYQCGAVGATADIPLLEEVIQLKDAAYA